MNTWKQYPSKITIGGQEVIVKNVDRLTNNRAGECCLYEGTIDIADTVNKDLKQSESSKRNTFYHELVHCILDSMGEFDLSSNEKFVCCFAGFLSDAMTDARFKEETK